MSKKVISRVAIVTNVGTSLQGSTILPGPLLASFEAWELEDDVQKFAKAGASSLILFSERSAAKAPKDTKRQPIHVLILGEPKPARPGDEGTTDPAGKEEK